MLSSEATRGEITWSLAEYITGVQVWQAFKLPGSPPPAYGVFANQPSPYGASVASSWSTWLWLNVGLAALVLFLHDLFSGPGCIQRPLCFLPRASLLYRASRARARFVTPAFQLDGRDSNVKLSIHTDLDNNWAYFNFALINDKTGQAFDFGREVSYYRDSDGSEGKR